MRIGIDEKGFRLSGTNRNRETLDEGPAIILVEPQLGENIGMVARAMANFGLGELRLVNPRDGWPNEKAHAAASGAAHVVERASVFSSLVEACADLRYLYATTARPRDMIKPVIGPVDAARKLRMHYQTEDPAGVLFGRERWGLNNDEIAICDAIVTFPVNPGFASLNIAQAVLLMSYEWMKTRESDAAETALYAIAARPATRRDLAGLIGHLEKALDDADYFHPPEKRERMVLNMKNICAHAGLSEPEIRALRGMIASLERRWAKGRQRVE
jgi:tRNA/rRNA methyltransferase